AGGSSFSQVEDLSSFQSANRALFFQRWEKIHTQEESKFRLKAELDRVRHPSTLTVNRRYAKESLDVLFILPSMARRYGGIRVVNALCGSLLREGLRTAVLTQERIKDEADLHGLDFTPWQSPENLKHHVEKIGLIVATSHATIPQAETLAKDFGAAFTAFLQGPEIAFGSGARFHQTWEEYRRLPHAICVSDFLVEYLGNYTKAPIDVARFGPDPLVFYPLEITRQKKSIAIAINKQPEKGSGMALQFGLLAKQRGYHLVLFGFEADEKKLNLPQGFAECLGPLDSSGLAKLFNRMEFIADFSIYEGLGLLPLEAAFCGAIPLLTSKGGPDRIFTDGENALFIPSFVESAALLERVESLNDSEKERLRAGAIALRHKVGQRSACEDFLSIVRKRWLKAPLTTAQTLVTPSESPSFAAVMRDRRHLQKARERQGHKAYRKDNHHLSHALREARQHAEFLENTIKAMHESLSWRITQPLRSLRQALFFRR
ncbi:MAG: glycosyltransferase family 4 protein, partial [Alphaproteobacteria bacterium]|nr:glycosyltransferase family 4 protein [Alphaproteobacteria bacterium]